MMKLNKVTITGADDKVDHSELIDLKRRYPFVEWGILFHHAKEGHPRFPSRNWVELIDYDIAAHFCGGFSDSVLSKGDFDLITTVPSPVKRIQLNYNFKGATRFNREYTSVLEALMKYMVNCDKQIIFQYNMSNANIVDWIVLHRLLPEGKINILYDSSGGRGKRALSFGLPFSAYTGYSGGIDPENVEKVLETITCYRHDLNFWIDMETGVRNGSNNLDLKKVETVLSICSKYVNA